MLLALLRQRERAMDSREGSEQPVIFCAVLMTLWRALLSAAVQPEYHAEMQQVSTLSIVVRQKATISLHSRLFFLSTLRKCSRCCAFFTVSEVLTDHERSSDKLAPRNLKVWTFSTQSPLMWSGAGSALCLLQSRINSFVFVVFSDRLLSEHHTVSFCTSSLYADSSSSDMSPITVVSSANLMMVLVGWVGVQSWVYKEYSSGLSTQPCGEPVLRVMVEERWGPSFTVCGRFERKSFIQVQMEGERSSASQFADQ